MKKFPCLSSCKIEKCSKNNLCDICNFLCSLPLLQNISLTSSRSSEGIGNFQSFSFFQKKTNLRKLKFDCYLEWNSSLSLYSSISKCPKLEKISIYSSIILPVCEELLLIHSLIFLKATIKLPPEKSSKLFAHSLKTNTTLRNLSLCFLDGEKNCLLRAIFNGIKQNSALQALRLQTSTKHKFELQQENLLSESNLKRFTKAFKVNQTLQLLSLKYCRLGPAAVYHVAEIIKCNVALLTLLLPGNSFGENNWDLVASSLSRNSTLHTLDLSFNAMKDEGVSKLLSNNINSSLTKLKFVHNGLSDKSLPCFQNFLIFCTSLLLLKIGFNSFSYSKIQELRAIHFYTKIIS